MLPCVALQLPATANSCPQRSAARLEVAVSGLLSHLSALTQGTSHSATNLLTALFPRRCSCLPACAALPVPTYLGTEYLRYDLMVHHSVPPVHLIQITGCTMTICALHHIAELGNTASSVLCQAVARASY